MTDFNCTTCGASFSIPEAALQKYPGWVPKFCREHSPKKQATSSPKKKSASKKSSVTKELDLPVREVLARYTAGPKDGVFTDGSARPNPGAGGWGAVWVKNEAIIREEYGSAEDTTNNCMELTALIKALTFLPRDETETIYTDSELCVNILTKWAPAWKKNGWKRKTGPIKNLELVKEVYALYVEHPNVTVKWIEAHSGWRWNEYADSLATAWARAEF